MLDLCEETRCCEGGLPIKECQFARHFACSPTAQSMSAEPAGNPLLHQPYPEQYAAACEEISGFEGKTAITATSFLTNRQRTDQMLRQDSRLNSFQQGPSHDIRPFGGPEVHRQLGQTVDGCIRSGHLEFNFIVLKKEARI